MPRYVTFAGHPLMSHSPDDDEWKDITFYFNATIIAVLFCCFNLLLYFAIIIIAKYISLLFLLYILDSILFILYFQFNFDFEGKYI